MQFLWVFLLHAGAYLALGLLVSIYLYRHKFWPAQFIVLFSFGVIAFLYYLVFFAALIKPEFGNYLNVAIYVLGFISLIYGFIKLSWFKANTKVVILILLPIFIIGMLLAYYAILLDNCTLPVNKSLQATNSQYCYLSGLTGDNTLPLVFAINIDNAMPKALSGNWKLVDRSPIQISAALGVLGLTKNRIQIDKSYQLVATFLQLSWVAAIFGFLITLGLSIKKTIEVIGMMSFVGVIFINSIFVWPKLFSAGFVLVGCLFILNRKDRYYGKRLVSAAILFALGLLIHDAIAFTIMGLAIVLLYILSKELITKKRSGFFKSFPWKPAIIGAVGAGLLMLPWILYKDANSTSDRLIKWQLAGVINPTSQSTLSTLIDAYKKLSFNTWLHYKFVNIQILYTPYLLNDFAKAASMFRFSLSAIKSSLHYLSISFQDSDFFVYFFALGLFNIGWVTQLFRRFKMTVLEARLLAVSIVTMVVWIILMFLPGSTIIHQGSYATLLTIFALLGFWLARYKFFKYLFFLQFVIFSIIWVLGTFYRYGVNLKFPVLLLDLLSGATVFVIFILLARFIDKLMPKQKLAD